MKNEKTRTYGVCMTCAACSARRKRCRCGPNGSVTGTLPIGEPMDEMPMPRSAAADFIFCSSSSVRSSTLVFQTLRSSMQLMDSCASVSSCSSNSGEISSAKPVKIHTCYHTFAGGGPQLAVRESFRPFSFLDTYGPAGTGRLVECLDYRERPASFREVYRRLAALPHGLDEVPDLVAVSHGEAARVRAGAGSRRPTIARHDLLGLVLSSARPVGRSEEHTSELQSLTNLVCRLLLEKKKKKKKSLFNFKKKKKKEDSNNN